MNRRLVAGAALLAAAVAVLLAARLTQAPRSESGWAGLRFAATAREASERLEGNGPSLDVARYRSGGEPRAAVLLLHGNRREGADHPLYRVLAVALAERGADVRSFSLRGFGASDPAPEVRPLEGSDLRSDLSRALIEVERSAPPRLPRVLVGHSLGANLALGACGRPGWTVIAIEPGLHLRRRVVDPPAPELAEFAAKLRENVRGGVIDGASTARLYAAIDPEAAGPPVAPGTCVVLYSNWLGAADRVAVEAVAAARPGTSVGWVGNRRHDFGVIGAGAGAVYPGPRLDEVTDAIRRLGWD